MTDAEQDINDIIKFLDGGKEDVGLALEFPIYLVMSHYHLGPKDLEGVSLEGFSLMFRWAMAHKQVEAEQMKDMDTAESTPIESTSMSKPMPFSEGW